MRTKQIIGLILLGCIIAILAVLAGLIAWLGAATGTIVGLLIAAGVVGTYLVVVGPWQRRWGATDEEVHRAMPGDVLLRPDAPTTTRAITVDASPEVVFPWLMQIGYERGGWYSYDWIDNDGKPSIERIDPALQGLAVGDRIEMLPGLGPIVREIVSNHHVVSGGETDSWCLLVEPTPDRKTRLISRWRQDWPNSAGTFVWIALSDPGAFLMEQKMLRRIRYLAERVGAAKRGHPSDHAEPRTDVLGGEDVMTKRRIGRSILDAVGGLPLFATAPLYRHWHLRWGATDEEVRSPMPGDEIVPEASFNGTRAVTIDAPPDRVWPWIVQMGYRRAGFYTYALLDNAGYESADRILDEYQPPRVNDWMPMAKKINETTAFKVKAFELDEWLLWEKPDSTWAWKLVPLAEGRTRLLSRLKARYAWESPGSAILTLVLLEFGDFPMMRRVLKGIKFRAERMAQSRSDETSQERSPASVTHRGAGE